MFLCLWFATICLLGFSTTTGEEHDVTVGPTLTFDPKVLEINVGDTVIFSWSYGAGPEPIPHTVTESISLKKKCLRVEGGFHSGVKTSGATWSHTFTKVENVTYHCETTGDSCQNCAGGMWGQIFVMKEGAKPVKPKKSPTMGPPEPEMDQFGYGTYQIG